METGPAEARKRSETVSVQETTDLVGVVRRTVHRWQSQGRMPPRIPNGRRLQYRRADIVALVSSDIPRGSDQGNR
jgi:predicted site-specific integrase-resolvase